MKIKRYTPLLEAINISKKIKSFIAPDYGRTEANKLQRDVERYTKGLSSYIKEIEKTYRGNDADNATKLFLQAVLSDKSIKPKEDFNSFMDFLSAFHKHKVKGFDFNKDNYNDFKVLVMKAVAKAQQKGGDVSDTIEAEIIEKEAKKVYDKGEWIIYIPKTERASCILGQNTDWCTAYDPERSNNMFKHYNRQGPLYVIINKKDPEVLFQLHYESKQIMDKYDRNIGADGLEEETNEDVINALYKLIVNNSEVSTIREIYNVDEIVSKHFDRDAEKTLSVLLSDDYYTITEGWDIWSQYARLSLYELADLLPRKEMVILENFLRDQLDKAGHTEVDVWEADEVFDDLHTAFVRAAVDCGESGTLSELMTFYLRELKEVINENYTQVNKESIMTMSFYELSQKKFYKDSEQDPSLYQLFNDDDDEDIDEVSIHEPRYGFDGFDTEYYPEALATQIQEVLGVYPKFK